MGKISFLFLVFLSLGIEKTAGQEGNTLTLLFGSEALLENLQYEIKDIKEEIEDIREGLPVNQQSLATPLLHQAELEDALEKQKDEILEKLQVTVVEPIAAQNLLLDRILNTLNKQMEIMEMLENNQLNNKRQNETEILFDPIFHTPLRNEVEEQNKSTAKDESVSRANNEGGTSIYPQQILWPSYSTFYPAVISRVVGVNTKPPIGASITASSCDEAIRQGNVLEQKHGGIFALNMNAYNLGYIYAYCLPDPSGGPAWLVIQRRINDNISFVRSNPEYQLGFGNLADNFFIGLDALQKMITSSSKNTQLWIQLGTATNQSPYVLRGNFALTTKREQREFSRSKLNRTHKLRDILWEGWRDIVYVHMAIR